MRYLILLLLPVAAVAQPIPAPAVPCTATKTTNCYLKADSTGKTTMPGSLAIGTTIPGGAPASSVAIAGKYYGDGSALTGISGGSGSVVLTSGAGAPSANCAAPSSSNLAIYLDTTNQEQWWCSATNTWKKVVSTTGLGDYYAAGGAGVVASGTAAARPSCTVAGFYLASDTHAVTACDGVAWTATLNPTGNVVCLYDGTSLTQTCYDASGNAFTSVKGIANPSDTQVVNYIGTDGVQHRIAQTAGGSTVTAGAFGSLPSCTTSGTVYLFTDSFYGSAFCNGATWAYLFHGHAVTPLTTGALTTINASTSSVSTNGGAVQVAQAASASSAHNWTLKVKALPAPPYTATIIYTTNIAQGDNTRTGFIIRNSVSGKFIQFGSNNAGASMLLVADAWTDATTYGGANYIDVGNFGYQPFILRIVDDGTNRLYQWSADNGLNFVQLASQLNNTFMVPDQVGFGISNFNSAVQITALSLVITTP